MVNHASLSALKVREIRHTNEGMSDSEIGGEPAITLKATLYSKAQKRVSPENAIQCKSPKILTSK